jgi:isoleucyl-tRNA synthetase
MKEKNEIAKKEEEILKFWEDNEIFKKSKEKSSSKGEYIFYEGPPTANGIPGMHHMEARAFKDTIPRYKTMRGYHVRRKAGWDTHGLPVEIAVEKELGLHSKKDIEEYGIEKFNKKCKESVWKYVDLWGKFTNRIGFWLDYENPYITYKPEYMESVWNVLKQADNQKLLYKDYRIVNWCPRCGTGLSGHELAQGYQEVHDMSVYVKFKVVNGEKHKLPENTYLLAWTTTPWTLPGNVALAVEEKIKYKILKISDESLIIAEDRVECVMKDKEYEVSGNLIGKDLIGLEYESLYSYLKDTLPESESKKLKNAYKVYNADFVNIKDGAGIVHTAVMYGADDFALGAKEDLPKHHLVNEDGRFIQGTDFLEGKKVRGANEEIIKDLEERNILFAKERVKHTYPHCWRCKTALIYYARDSWYIKMSKLRDELVKENNTINWEPKHIKEGRFGEWLREVKDWAISRERYWATPLPVWQSQTGVESQTTKVKSKNDFIVIGSIEELKRYTKKSGNRYFVMRHGEAKNNILGIISSKINNPHHLTERGKQQISDSVKKIKNKKIDLIISSPFVRTRETAELVADRIGIDKSQIIYEQKIQEIQAGEFEGKTIEEYHKYFNSIEEYFEKACPSGENFAQIKNRMGNFIYDLENKYKDKNILIITHDAPGWLLFSVASGDNVKDAISKRGNKENFIKNAEIKELDFASLPHNENYELDLHRPYIDEIELIDKNGNKLTRVKEVMDVWFDSGAMPFAQDHYPFENKEWVDGIGYPADFISEAIDQTRGWFYTLHAVGALMGRGKAYKNAISLGHILDNKGKKMSKSVGNVVDPWEMIDKYGADALRFWMYIVNQPGDSKNFEERSVDEIVKKVFNLLNNIIKFYEIYETKEQIIDNKHLKSKNILDVWILAKLDKLIKDTTKSLDKYHLFEPAREIREFITDFSQWYIRRSRDRFKIAGADKEHALATTRYVLLELSKLMAPFTPFIAEQVYQKVRSIDTEESVHLAKWPNELKAKREKSKVLEDMIEVRKIVSLGLEARASAGIKVRQPLASLKLKVKSEKLSDELLQLIKDEVNVKEVLFIAGKGLSSSRSKAEQGGETLRSNEVELDTSLTQDLIDEGALRELTRAIQNARKVAELTPQDFINLDIETDKVGKNFIEKFEDAIKTGALIKEINFTKVSAEEIKIEPYNFKFKIEK